MKQTVFIFGRTPELAFLELQSLFPGAVRIADTAATVDSPVDPDAMIRRLGGTVKIATAEEVHDTLTADILADAIAPHAKEGKVTFGFSIYGKISGADSLLRSVKETLSRHAVTARYVEPKHGSTLGSVVVEKQRVTELVIIETGGKYLLGATAAVQPFEDWNTRDFGRPAADPHRGMLPPKVARMIANIALAGKDTSAGPVLLDPFCGMGTVLMEGALLGARVVGCDISAPAVQRAQKNMDWARAEYGLLQKAPPDIRTADATHVSEFLAEQSVDAIATEPFMGEPMRLREGEKIPASKAKNILKGLEKLYIGSLKEWMRILRPGGRVVMAMPAYVTDHGVMRVKNVIDRCEMLGYTLLIGPIEYSRPHAVVRREFYIFERA